MSGLGGERPQPEIRIFVIPAEAGTQLSSRIHQHRHGLMRGFARQYGVKLLVWFEQHSTMESAIIREKRIKKWNRAWKLELIEADNPEWRDLAEDFGFERLQ